MRNRAVLWLEDYQDAGWASSRKGGAADGGDAGFGEGEARAYLLAASPGE